MSEFLYKVLVFVSLGGGIIYVIVRIWEFLQDFWKNNLSYETRFGDKRAIDQMPIQTFREQLFKELGVEIFYTEGARYWVNFRGGKFNFNFAENNQTFNVIFPGFAELKHENARKAYRVINSLNLKYNWSTYLAYDNEAEKPIQASCSFLFVAPTTINECVEILRTLLDEPFEISREFHGKMQAVDNEEDGVDVQHLIRDAHHKIYYNCYKAEVAAAKDLAVESDDGRLTIANILALSPNVDMGYLEGMRIICGSNVEMLSNAEEVLTFDIKDYVAKNHTLHNRFTLLLDFEKESLTIDLQKKAGGDEKHILYLMTVARNGSDVTGWGYAPICFRTAIEVRLTSEKEDVWEAKYMIEDMRENATEGGIPSAVQALDEQNRLNYYWGLKLFNDNNFLQALPYLKRVYNNLHSLQEDCMKEIFLNVSYMIGYTYMQLNMPDAAYIYLEPVVESAKFPTPLFFFACCVSQVGGARAIEALEGLRSVAFDMIKEADDESAHDMADFVFMQINRIYINQMFKYKMYDATKEELNKFLECEFDVDFMNEMLDKISGIENKENCRTDNV